LGLDRCSDRGRSVVFMKATIICIALVLGTPALGQEIAGQETAPKHRAALMSRITCPAIREAVKLYGASAAEQWARGNGISERKIEQAKRCLR
jgi:hypothetical protein